jgi:hypothetical protein
MSTCLKLTFAQCEHLLDCNLVFLFEGEEEAHSDGFREAMAQLSAQPVEETGLESESVLSSA